MPPAGKLEPDGDRRPVPLGGARAPLAGAVPGTPRPRRAAADGSRARLQRRRPVGSLVVPAASRRGRRGACPARSPRPGPSPGPTGPRNPIDRFILKRLLEKGLTPAPEADRRTLDPPRDVRPDGPAADARGGRRVPRRSRPPTPTSGWSTGCWPRPRYGERWGRHWLDLVRYAESDGYRQDAYRPDAWRYRDYVIRSLQRRQALRPLRRRAARRRRARSRTTPSCAIATGYLRLGTYEFNQRDVRGQWADILNDITDVTGEVFLGLSIGCARCHDHKFDPILQKDYYRLQAFFTPAPAARRPDRWHGPASGPTTSRQLAAWEQATADVRRQIAAIEAAASREAPRRARSPSSRTTSRPSSASRRRIGRPLEVQLAAPGRSPGRRSSTTSEPALKGQEKARRDDLQQAAEPRSIACRPVPPPPVLTVDRRGTRSPRRRLIPGGRKAEPIEPGFLSVLDPAPGQDRARRPRLRDSTGRRLALARWLTRPDNPLEHPRDRQPGLAVPLRPGPRGHVERLRPAGRGALAIPSCSTGWPAEFVAEGWRLKPLHRLIMTSATYRQSAERSESEVETARRIDPDNRLLWKRTRPAARRRGDPRRDAGRLGRARPGDRRPGGRDRASPAGRSTRR